MLKLVIPSTEYFDEETCSFVQTKEQTLQLEHSLISVSKWESKWHKPFLSNDEKTQEETLDYVRCMTINSNVDPLTYYSITPTMISEINGYIENTMTATWFSNSQNGVQSPSREVITSEIIYYWMVALEIPFECEKWHLNRLLTLIRVCNIKNSPGKKMSKKDLYGRNHALNAARRNKLHTHG